MTIPIEQIDAAIAFLGNMPHGRRTRLLLLSGLALSASDVELRSALQTMTELPAFLRSPDPVLEGKIAKKAAIDALYYTKTTDIGATCQTSFGLAQCDDAYPLNSRSTITGAVVMATIALRSNLTFSQAWAMADNSKVVMTAPMMIQFGVEVGQFISTSFNHKSTLKEAVEAATTLQEINAINITVGW